MNRGSVEVDALGVILLLLPTTARPDSLRETMHDERAIWLGCGVAVLATLVLTTVAATLETTLNTPGDRSVAAPVLWAVGGGLGLCIGAFVAAWLTRRAGPGILAAGIGAIPYLVLVVVAYNDDSLGFEDQLVGSIVIVVLPGVVAAVVCAVVAAYAARLLRRQPSPARKSVTT